MKTRHFSGAACIALSIFAASCSNDETTVFPENRGLTSFSGSMNSETPVTRASLGEYGISEDILSRSSMERDSLKAGGVFYWESGDHIYVEDGSNSWKKSTNNVDEKTDKYEFLFDTSSEKDSYAVHYTGPNSMGHSTVLILETQEQSDFNKTEHLGKAGDCAVATATKTADGSGFNFNLQHKSSYLCFLPYVSNVNKAAVCKLKKIILSSDENISGIYTLSETGLTNTGASDKDITLDVGANGEGLSLKDVTQADITKSLYMVIAPGTHNLQAKYIVFDESTNKEDTITKNYNTSKNLLDASKVYNVPVDLSAGISGLYSEQELEPITYKFKLIFHLLQNDKTNRLSYVNTTHLQAIVDKINKFYAGNGSTTDAKMVFELADSIGKEKGLTRTTVTEESIGYDAVINERPGQKFYEIGWDRSKYINIYVFTVKEGNIGGASPLPKIPQEVAKGGDLIAYGNEYASYNVSITLNASQLENWVSYGTGTFAYYPTLYTDLNPVNTLSHELGHYLGLRHSFYTSAEPQDYCDDTKEYDRDKYMETYNKFIPKLQAARTLEQLKAVSDTLYLRRAISDDSVFRSYNIMDYFYTEANKFTPDQVKRMRRYCYYSTTVPGPKVYLGTPPISRATSTECSKPYIMVCPLR